MKTRLITIHKNINQALTTKRGNKMGYAVSYKRSGRPTSRRAKRQSPANKAQRTKDMKNAIRWNVAQLEHDRPLTRPETMCCSSLSVKATCSGLASAPVFRCSTAPTC